MAYYEGTKPDTDAGRLIEIFNAILLLNSYWSKVDDTANGMAANSAVYRCYDPYGPTDFYLKVDNNYAGYAVIEGWEGWNAVTHAGIGISLTYGASATYYLRIYYTQSWAMQVENFRFSLLTLNGNMHHYFIGRPDELFDETKNIVLFVVRSTSATDINPFGYGTDSANSRTCRFLFDETGVANSIAKLSLTGPIATIGGSVLIDECRVINTITSLVVGVIHKNVACGENILTAYGGNVYQIQGKQWIVAGRGTHYNSLMMKG